MICRPRTALIRVLLCSMTTMATISGAALTPSALAAEVSCNRWQALHVSGLAGEPLVVRNKPSINRNDEGMCLSVAGNGANFTVVRSPGNLPSLKVRAYPYIGTGCFEGACSSHHQGRLPRAGALGNYTVSWSTSTPANSGKWNSSLDLWLGPHSGIGSTEIMIWLQYSGPSWWVNLYPKVWIDGAQWYEVPHTTPEGQYYMSFRRASPVTSATLRLAPFMARAIPLGVVSPNDLLWAVQAGFEIWSGGAGLAVTSFSTSH